MSSPELRRSKHVYEKYLSVLELDEEQTSPTQNLNSYQRFVQQNSKKLKYRSLSPRSRISAIAKKWRSPGKKDKNVI